MKKNRIHTDVIREFFVRPELLKKFDVVEQFEKMDVSDAEFEGDELNKNAADALTKLLSKRWRRKPTLLLKTFSRLLEDTDTDEEKYIRCCQSAICQAIIKDTDQAEKCILKASEIDDDQAFHHHIYGLIHGMRGECDKALFEFHLALERDPAPDSVERILKTQAYCTEEISMPA